MTKSRRVLRFRLHLDRYDYTIQHVPGKELYTADTLSRAPVSKTSSENAVLEELAEMCMLETISHLPASFPTLQKYRKVQTNDPVCQVIIGYCQNGWPEYEKIDRSVKPYWDFQGEITIGDGLLLCGGRIVVP